MLNQSVAEAIFKMSGEDLFITSPNDIWDFTRKDFEPTLAVCSPSLRIDFGIPAHTASLFEVLNAIKLFLFKEKTVVLGWNLKELFSFVQHKTGKPFKIPSKVLDLKLLENYLGIDREKPHTFVEARARLGALVKMPGWNEAKTIFNDIYLPLISDVVPALENVGLTSQQQKKVVYSHYEIAGQANGRMKCAKCFINSFNPHSLDQTDRQSLTPTSYEETFLSFDFHQMEVSVLQWLSKDPILGEILKHKIDVYRAIWKLVTGMDCDDANRDRCKQIFLPVIFGKGSAALAELFNGNQKTAATFIERLRARFSTAFEWVDNAQAQLGESGIARDHYGRLRKFAETEHYKVRNFVIQSPASIICLHKLIQLSNTCRDLNARLAMHIHDGYVLCVEALKASEAYQIIRPVLETDDALYPGIHLSVSAQVGRSLADLQLISG